MMSLRCERDNGVCVASSFLFSESQESNNEYGCSYSVMRVVGNGSTVILNSISLPILSDDQLKCNGQPAVFCLRTEYTCLSVTSRQKSNPDYQNAFIVYSIYVYGIYIYIFFFC